MSTASATAAAPRSHHGRLVLTVIRGALMPKCPRKRRRINGAPIEGLWNDRKRKKAHRLGQSEHQVHVLDRLARGALDQIVLGDQDHREIGPLRTVDRNA